MRFMPFFEEKTLGSRFPIVYVCMDDYDGPLWDVYNVVAVPTLILFEDGKVSHRLDSLPGSCIKNETFVAWLQKIQTVS